VKTWLRRTVRALAVAYPVSLLALVLMLRFAGEGFWVTTAALYLPRIGFAAPLPFIALGLYAARMRRLLSLQIASALLIVFPLMGFVLPWPVSADAKAPRVRVLSFNVNVGHGGADAVVAEIDRYSPDVVLLQEVGDGGAFASLLGSHYPTVHVSGQFILATRYDLTSTAEPPRLPYYGELRSPRFIEHVLETPLGPVSFYNVHPISPREALFALRGRSGLKREIGSGRILGSSAAPLIAYNAGLRTLQVERLWESASRETGPVVVAGDTNLPGLSRTLHRTLSGFQDGFRRASWGFGYTFPTNKWRPWMRLDRVFANGRLRFVGFQVSHSVVSDHRCVVADLQAAAP
jgi:endonuclease/exonuclease/phosphatase (EEP) superfamily protein YafD